MVYETEVLIHQLGDALRRNSRAESAQLVKDIIRAKPPLAGRWRSMAAIAKKMVKLRTLWPQWIIIAHLLETPHRFSLKWLRCWLSSANLTKRIAFLQSYLPERRRRPTIIIAQALFRSTLAELVTRVRSCGVPVRQHRIRAKAGLH